MKFNVGDRVKIISTEKGAYGVNGREGVITNDIPTNGRMFSESEINVNVDGVVWAIGRLEEVELELVKPAHNKAQRAVLEDFCRDRYGDFLRFEDLSALIDEYNAVDATPDPKTYALKCDYSGATKDASVINTGTLEEMRTRLMSHFLPQFSDPSNEYLTLDKYEDDHIYGSNGSGTTWHYWIEPA